MAKYKYAIIIICVITVIIGISTIIFYNIRQSNTTKGAEIVSNSDNGNIIISSDDNVIINNIVTTSSSTEKISPNAIMIFNEYYKECGHTIKTREDIKEELVNCTKEEVETLCSNWQILRFSTTEIELYKESEGECDEHYLVKDNEGVIIIYKIDKNNSMEVLQNTEISTQYLSDIDLMSLKEGVFLVGKEELNAYIENFE